MPAAAVRRTMCAPPISNGWSPKVFEILILTFVPPALVCTMRRRLWFLKRWRLPGMNGCGAVAHVPIDRLPWASSACEVLIAVFFAAFCAIVGMDIISMSVKVMVLEIIFIMGRLRRNDLMART